MSRGKGVLAAVALALLALPAIDRAQQSQGESVSRTLVSDQAARKTTGADADGEVVWSWHPLLVLNLRRCVTPTGL